ncbi:MAG: hypothetical protein KBD83_06010 [Gammaproteobacteria bacterium]|jgi:hypothetical protein|nr:hypothetical protein [Gammaproteobacteria bacterium]
MAAQIRMVGANGQVSIGKKFAGRFVLIDALNENDLIIKPGEFVPNSQKWLHKDGNLEKIEKALERVRNTPPQDNFEELLEKWNMKDV